MFVGVLLAVGAAAVSVVAIALVLLLVQLFTSDKIAMSTMGVKEVTPAQEPELHGIVERLCGRSAEATVCVMETPMPNAFAMGRSKKSTSVCATRGILDLLSAKLEGVMAHELTHVINRDVMVMTLASFFATLASLMVDSRCSSAEASAAATGATTKRRRGSCSCCSCRSISFLLLRALSPYPPSSPPTAARRC